MTTAEPNQPTATATPTAAAVPVGETALAHTAAGPVTPTAAEVHVAEIVLARVAAYYARAVPGVATLQPGLAQRVLGLAGRFLGPSPLADPRLSADGVTVDLDEDGLAHIEVTAVTRLGYNCRDVAEAIQQQVTTQVQAHTGLPAVVTITILDIDLNTGTDHGPAAGPPPAHGAPR